MALFECSNQIICNKHILPFFTYRPCGSGTSVRRSFPRGCRSPAENKMGDISQIAIWGNFRWGCGLIPAVALCWILWQTEGTWLGQSGQSFAKHARTCMKNSKCKSLKKSMKRSSLTKDKNCTYQTIWRLVTLYLWYSVFAFKSSMLMSGKPESNSSNSCSLKIAINLGCKSLRLDHRTFNKKFTCVGWCRRIPRGRRPIVSWWRQSSSLDRRAWCSRPCSRLSLARFCHQGWGPALQSPRTPGVLEINLRTKLEIGLTWISVEKNMS